MRELKVIKADGSIEDYLYTKVLGAISNAMAGAGQLDILTAEQLADAVTYFLYQDDKRHKVSSGEILSIIEATLDATGYEQVAAALSNYHYERRLRRGRIEVISVDMQQMGDAEILAGAEQSERESCWDKGRIVDYLVSKHRFSRQRARAIASMVEEKVFNMGIRKVPSSLIKQLVLGDTATVLRAERQLQTV